MIVEALSQQQANPIKTISYLDIEGNLSTSCTHIISDDILVRGMKAMLKTRIVDERMLTLQRQGTISFALSSTGEECCSIATAAALEMGDWIYPQYREVGVMFWRDYPLQDYLHQMFCNGKDILLGRQMPGHFGLKELNVVTCSSPLGTKIPHAAGCAYAMKLQKQKNVAVSFFGEGTSSKGDFHTGLNFAVVRKSPAIFFCRNNGFAISTPTSSQFATDGVAPKGAAYGITTYRVDGNDFFAVHETVTKARKHALDGKGPVLIEGMTYRLGAHSSSDDPSMYRKDSEVEAWEKKDPILRLRRYLEIHKLWSEKQEQAFVEEVKSELDSCIAASKATPPPPIESLIEDVYFETPYTLREQYDEITK